MTDEGKYRLLPFELKGASTGTSSTHADETTAFQGKCKYELPWPYKLKVFEKELADLEVRHLLGDHVVHIKEGLEVIATSQPSIHALKNLTSFHFIIAKCNGKATRLCTNQAILERTTPLLRTCRNWVAVESKIRHIMNIPVLRREKQYLFHELHPYKGRYYPQLIKPLLNISARRGDRVLDPFCGCGTTLLEAYFSGIHSVGVDLNPIACFISKVKIYCLSIDPIMLLLEVENLLSKCRKKIQKFRGRCDKAPLEAFFGSKIAKDETGIQKMFSLELPRIPNAKVWFSEGVLEELAVLLDEVGRVEDERVRDFFRLTISSIVKKVSNWDPEQVRQRLLETPRKEVHVLEIFEKQLMNYYLVVYSWSKIRSMVEGNHTVNCEVYQHDSRHLEFLEDESFDAIVTSPPYATALPYLDTDRLPMYVLGLLKPESMRDFKDLMIGERDITPKRREELEREFLSGYEELPLPLLAKQTIRKILFANRSSDVGFRRKNMASTLYRYFIGMQDCIHEMSRLIKPGGICCIVIGDNRTMAGGKETVWIETHKILMQMSECDGFKLMRTIRMAPTSPYMIHVNNMIRDEYILILKKET